MTIQLLRISVLQQLKVPVQAQTQRQLPQKQPLVQLQLQPQARRQLAQKQPLVQLQLLPQRLQMLVWQVIQIQFNCFISV